MWPFTQKREADASPGTYTDALLAGIIAAASGTNATPESVSATETAAGTWARAFMAARVLPPGLAAEALTPELLGQIGNISAHERNDGGQLWPPANRSGRIPALPGRRPAGA